jgi:hypothetical protein
MDIKDPKKPVLLIEPLLLSRVLFDVFGVLTNPVCFCEGPGKSKIMNLSFNDFN